MRAWSGLLLPSLVALLAGCAGPGEGSGGPTYWTDVKPIIETHCTRCHHADGLGSGDWTDAAQVQALGEAMLASVEAGRMPPPTSDPACQDFHGSEQLVMADAARQTLRDWVDAGKPMGSPDEAVAGDQPVLDLADADTVFQLPAPYTPTFSDPTFPGNEYRCFVLENTDPEAFYITALSPMIDAQEIAHHIVISRIDKEEDLPAHERNEGFACQDYNILDGMLAGWAPGMVPVRMPEGRGMRVSPDQDLIIQMHYFESRPGEAISDQSGYKFVTERDVDTNVLMLPIGSYNWTIPAGDPAYTHHTDFNLADAGVPGDVDLYGVFPHMHVLGSAWRYWIEHPDGSTTCLSESDRYDFDNQMTYIYEDPPRITPQDTIHFECTWNNSTSNPDLIYDPPINTRFGDGTDAEMCFMFTYGALAN